MYSPLSDIEIEHFKQVITKEYIEWFMGLLSKQKFYDSSYDYLQQDDFSENEKVLIEYFYTMITKFSIKESGNNNQVIERPASKYFNEPYRVVYYYVDEEGTKKEFKFLISRNNGWHISAYIPDDEEANCNIGIINGKAVRIKWISLNNACTETKKELFGFSKKFILNNTTEM